MDLTHGRGTYGATEPGSKITPNMSQPSLFQTTDRPDKPDGKSRIRNHRGSIIERNYDNEGFVVSLAPRLFGLGFKHSTSNYATKKLDK